MHMTDCVSILPGILIGMSLFFSIVTDKRTLTAYVLHRPCRKNVLFLLHFG